MNKRMRTVYPREFKVRAVELAKRGDRSVRQLENELGLSENLLRHWVQEYDKLGEHAWIRAATLDDTGDESAAASPEVASAGEGDKQPTAEERRLRAELRSLQRQYQQLQQDNTILKKALLIFGQESG
jgi:transposase-like protein